MFNCDRCGACCRALDSSSIYASLNRGDGVCKYLDGNLCSIYENRPLLCRIDESYELLWKDIMDKGTYYRQNYEACKLLKMSEGESNNGQEG